MKRMLSGIFTASLMFFVLVGALPFINSIATGQAFYNPALNFVSCNERWECRHEVGHVMDRELGYPSKSDEFANAIRTYLYVRAKYAELDNITDVIYGTSGIFNYDERYTNPFYAYLHALPQQELYANIYNEVDGDISKLDPLLRAFYSDDPRYQRLYSEAYQFKYYLVKGDS